MQEDSVKRPLAVPYFCVLDSPVVLEGQPHLEW